MKPTSTSDPQSVAAAGGTTQQAGTQIPSQEASRSSVLMSIPEIRSASDDLLSHPSVEERTPSPKPYSYAKPKVSIVAISSHEPSRLQLLIQGARQRFIELMGGSVFWRLFVGSGAAIFIGSATLLLLSPNAEQITSNETSHPPTGLHDVHQESSADKKSPAAPVANSGVELTVSSTTQGDVPIPAEFDDPFRIENQVTPKAIPAVHYTEAEAGLAPTHIQPVSQVRVAVDQPAWLAGTIDVEEDGDSGQLKRKHERSRPSHR